MIYLDHAASSFRLNKYSSYHLNPNQPYAIDESKMIEFCKKRISKALNLRNGKLYFCHDVSTLMEQIEYKLRFLQHTNIVSNVEHDSVFAISNFLFSNIEELESQLKRVQNANWYNKSFVYHMLTNNITGQIYDIEKIGNLCKKYKSFYCCDLTSAIGHNTIPEHISMFCDMMFASGHKFGANPGIGFIWISDPLCKYMCNFSLSGTKNLNDIIKITECVERYANPNDNMFAELTRYLSNQMLQHNIRFYIVDNNKTKTSAINAVLLFDINANSLQMYLASKHIYISVGHSACAENTDFRVLSQSYVPGDRFNEVIRLSFSKDTRKREIKKMVEYISKYKKLYIFGGGGDFEC